MVVVFVDVPNYLGFSVLLFSVFFHPELTRMLQMGLLRALGVHREHRQQPLQVGALARRAAKHFFRPAGRGAHEALEMLMAGAAGVFVDRHLACIERGIAIIPAPVF